MLLPILILTGLGAALVLDRRSAAPRFGAIPDEATVRVRVPASDVFVWQLLEDEHGRTLPSSAKANVKLEVDGQVVEDIWMEEASWSHGEIVEWPVPWGSSIRVIVDGRRITPARVADQDLALDTPGGQAVLVPA